MENVITDEYKSPETGSTLPASTQRDVERMRYIRHACGMTIAYADFVLNESAHPRLHRFILVDPDCNLPIMFPVSPENNQISLM